MKFSTSALLILSLAGGLAGAIPAPAAEGSPIKEKETGIAAGYLLNNNVWGKDKSPQGWQLIDVLHAGQQLSWQVRYNWPVGSDKNSVKCYPSVVTGWQWGLWSTDGRLPQPVSSLVKVRSGATATISQPGVQNVAYDLWFHAPGKIDAQPKPTDELMIWTNRFGGAGPLGKKREVVEIDGAKWNLFVGDIGWKVFSFVRQENATAWNLDIKAFIDCLVQRGLMAKDKQLSGIQFGTEVFSSPGEASMVVKDYFVELESQPADAKP